MALLHLWYQNGVLVITVVLVGFLTYHCLVFDGAGERVWWMIEWCIFANY